MLCFVQDVLGARDEDARERCLKVYKEEKRKVKSYICRSKEEVQEQFGGKMNQDMNGNRKLFWKEVNKANGGKVENSNKTKDGNGTGWYWKRLKYKGFGRSIMRICIIQIPMNRLQSTCVALMEYKEATTLEESQLGEWRLS